MKFWIYINNNYNIVKTIFAFSGLLSGCCFILGFCYFNLINPLYNPLRLLWAFPLWIVWISFCIGTFVHFSCRFLELDINKK